MCQVQILMKPCWTFFFLHKLSCSKVCHAVAVTSSFYFAKNLKVENWRLSDYSLHHRVAWLTKIFQVYFRSQLASLYYSDSVKEMNKSKCPMSKICLKRFKRLLIPIPPPHFTTRYKTNKKLWHHFHWNRYKISEDVQPSQHPKPLAW